MDESKDYMDGCGNYVDNILWSSSDEDQESRSEIDEYHSPRFGEPDDCEENIGDHEELNFTLSNDENIDFENNIASSVDEYNYLEIDQNTLENKQPSDWNAFGENSSNRENPTEENIDENSDKKYANVVELEKNENNSYNVTTNDLNSRESEAKENMFNSNISGDDTMFELYVGETNDKISYSELQSQVKSLLEISNKHQEEVHAELDSLISENETLRNEIELLNAKLKESDLNTSKFKLDSIALSAQLPFLKSITMLDDDKEELNSLRDKVKILETKLNEAENEIENYKASKEKVSDLENELKRVTNEFSELEKFQTEQLRVADNEIIALTEAKNKIFRDLHKVIRENESLKLTKTVIKRIESYYKNENELVLPNIENELNESISEFKENSDVSDPNIIKSAFDICQSIIPRLAFDIAEEIVISHNDSNEANFKNKKRTPLGKKNISIQVGFPLVSNGAFGTTEIDSISLRSELLTLRGENSKLKKENQKLKQDIFLIKRVRKTKGVNGGLQTGIVNQTVDSFDSKQKEEYMLNGIKWLTSVVNEIDELEQRCNKIKGVNNQSSDNKNSTGYNSTVASFEEIENIKSNDTSLKTENTLNKELNMLREKLVSEGLLEKD
ncbi:hypothetical protein FG379_000662 [Cryptosporidium bovis]|uniref:uncharacterized protein n=1 Tax=Cryptosporidium bovis TaxID=310047 RepID=UPI00351A99CA|nr:hypothetical protein FG379_000662 [Cryptosporidium bovis]